MHVNLCNMRTTTETPKFNDSGFLFSESQCQLQFASKTLLLIYIQELFIVDKVISAKIYRDEVDVFICIYK